MESKQDSVAPKVVVAEVVADVRIEVNDMDGVIGRYVAGDEHPYGVQTEREIINHLARCAVSMGVDRANRLDGWADLADDAALMDIETVDVDCYIEYTPAPNGGAQ